MREVRTSKNFKPCPFCGKEVRLFDYTANLYGFDGYEIVCECGCRLRSKSPREHYFVGNKYCTPMTERAKEREIRYVLELWDVAKRGE